MKQRMSTIALIMSDSITGCASGAYTNQLDAEEYLCHNWDLLNKALAEESYGDMGKLLEKGPEACDVAIRCYLLRDAIDEAVHELVDEELREYFDNEKEA